MDAKKLKSALADISAERDPTLKSAKLASLCSALWAEHGVELVVLAGFMRFLSSHFVNKYKNRILNIHPALLPSFKGTHGIKDALDYGVKVTGPTVHFVNEKLDAGPIIIQDVIIIKDTDTQGSLEKVMHKREHIIYPKAIKLFVEGKLKIGGRTVMVK